MSKLRKSQARKKIAAKKFIKSAARKKTPKRAVRKEVKKKTIVPKGIEPVAEQQATLPKETKILNEQNPQSGVVKNQAKREEQSKSTPSAIKRVIGLGIVGVVIGIVAKKIFMAWISKRNHRDRSENDTKKSV